MILLSAYRDGRISTCGPECWAARQPICRCICLGAAHGVGPEEAGRRIAALDLSTLAGVIVMPPLPFGVARAAESLVVAPEPPRRARSPRRSSATHCDGCGLPWGEVVLAAMVESGVLCDSCLRRLWRSAS